MNLIKKDEEYKQKIKNKNYGIFYITFTKKILPFLFVWTFATGSAFVDSVGLVVKGGKNEVIRTHLVDSSDVISEIIRSNQASVKTNLDTF